MVTPNASHKTHSLSERAKAELRRCVVVDIYRGYRKNDCLNMLPRKAAANAIERIYDTLGADVETYKNIVIQEKENAKNLFFMDNVASNHVGLFAVIATGLGIHLLFNKEKSADSEQRQKPKTPSGKSSLAHYWPLPQ